MNKLLKFFGKEKKYPPLKILAKDKEKEIKIQNSFVTQFAENQNHQQRLFIQFLSSVLVVIVAYAYVYSNTASSFGIKFYKYTNLDRTIYDTIYIKPLLFDSVKDDSGAIISYSQLSLISIYTFSQIVLLILSIMVLHMGYSFRRDQAVVNRIRKINIGKPTYLKIFGKRNFAGYGKGYLAYLPNFNSILFFSICTIQLILFFSIYLYFKDFGDEEFYVVKNTVIFPNYILHYNTLRTSLIFPVLVNLFTYN